jgi:antitoxin component YwqK of YwqJK toxin-antitoxin module
MLRFALNLSFVFCVLFLGFSQVNKTDAQGKKQGAWKKFYPNTQVLQYEGQFLNNQPIGEFRYYYPTGKVKAVLQHEKNTKKTAAWFYFENEQIMSEGSYSDMKKDAVWINYAPEGFIVSKESYLNDKLNGPRIAYYLEGQEEDAPKILNTALYKDSLLDGAFTAYFSNGKVMQSGKYLAGQKIDIWSSYHPNGALNSTERYKQGKLHGWIMSYDQEGTQISKILFNLGEKLMGEELDKYLENCTKKGIDPNE